MGKIITKKHDSHYFLTIVQRENPFLSSAVGFGCYFWATLCEAQHLPREKINGESRIILHIYVLKESLHVGRHRCQNQTIQVKGSRNLTLVAINSPLHPPFFHISFNETEGGYNRHWNYNVNVMPANIDNFSMLVFKMLEWGGSWKERWYHHQELET